MHPSYVVLVGDTTHVPTFRPANPLAKYAGFSKDVASDLDYSRDGSDMIADVQLGRLPAADLAAAKTVVAKTVAYESSAPAPLGDDFYTHATIGSYFQWKETGDAKRESRSFIQSAEKIAGGLKVGGDTIDRVYVAEAGADPQYYNDGTALPKALRKPAFAWDGDTNDLIADFNAGRHLIVHRDHGDWNAWSHPLLGLDHLKKLTNGTQLPVVLAIHCLSAKFDDPAHVSIDERLLQLPGGGAVAVVGASRPSSTSANTPLAIGLADALYPAVDTARGSATPLRTVGQMLISGKSYMSTLKGATDPAALFGLLHVQPARRPEPRAVAQGAGARRCRPVAPGPGRGAGRRRQRPAGPQRRHGHPAP